MNLEKFFNFPAANDDIIVPEQDAVASSEDAIEALRARRLPTLVNTYIQNYGEDLADYVNPTNTQQLSSDQIKHRPGRPSPAFRHVVGIACYYYPEAVDNLETSPDDRENPYLETLHKSLMDKLLPLRTYAHALFSDGIIPPSAVNAQVIMSFADVDIELDTKRFPTRRYRKANTIVRRARKHLDTHCRRLDQADLAVRAVVYTQLMNLLNNQIALTRVQLKKESDRMAFNPEMMNADQNSIILPITYRIAMDLFNEEPDLMNAYDIEDAEELDDILLEVLSLEAPLLVRDLLTRPCSEDDESTIRELVRSYLPRRGLEEDYFDQRRDVAYHLSTTMNNIPVTNEFERHLHAKTAKLNMMLRQEIDDPSLGRNGSATVLPFVRPRDHAPDTPVQPH